MIRHFPDLNKADEGCCRAREIIAHESVGRPQCECRLGICIFPCYGHTRRSFHFSFSERFQGRCRGVWKCHSVTRCSIQQNPAGNLCGWLFVFSAPRCVRPNAREFIFCNFDLDLHTSKYTKSRFQWFWERWFDSPNLFVYSQTCKPRPAPAALRMGNINSRISMPPLYRQIIPSIQIR